MKNKIIVIIGPTSSGKTKLAVQFANKFNGEIVSADSRQVYRGMDIGTGKDLKEYGKTPYYLIDVVEPNTDFNLAKYYKKARFAIRDIIKRGRMPIIAGGTGLYVQALVDGYNLSSSRPNKKLREGLEKLGVNSLFRRLEKLDKKFALKINNSDRNNKRRLIRYIEIIKSGENLKNNKNRNNDYEFLIIGLKFPINELRKRIYKRLRYRLDKEDMIGEVERLHHDKKVSWKRLESFGLEYKYISLYLKSEISYEKMVEKLNIAIGQFAKRQMTWYRRWERQGAKIDWIDNKREGERLVKKFLP